MGKSTVRVATLCVFLCSFFTGGGTAYAENSIACKAITPKVPARDYLYQTQSLYTFLRLLKPAGRSKPHQVLPESQDAQFETPRKVLPPLPELATRNTTPCRDPLRAEKSRTSFRLGEDPNAPLPQTTGLWGEDRMLAWTRLRISAAHDFLSYEGAELQLKEDVIGHLEANGQISRLIIGEKLTFMPTGKHPLNRMAKSIRKLFSGFDLAYEPSKVCSAWTDGTAAMLQTENEYSGGDVEHPVGLLLPGSALLDPAIGNNSAMTHELRHLNTHILVKRKTPASVHGGAKGKLPMGLITPYTKFQRIDEMSAYLRQIKQQLSQVVRLATSPNLTEENDVLTAALNTLRETGLAIDVSVRAATMAVQGLAHIERYGADRITYRVSPSTGVTLATIPVRSRATRYELTIPLVLSESVTDPRNLELLQTQLQWTKRTAQNHLVLSHLGTKLSLNLMIERANSPQDIAAKLLAYRRVISAYEKIERDPKREPVTMRQAIERYYDELSKMKGPTPLAVSIAY